MKCNSVYSSMCVVSMSLLPPSLSSPLVFSFSSISISFLPNCLTCSSLPITSFVCFHSIPVSQSLPMLLHLFPHMLLSSLLSNYTTHICSFCFESFVFLPSYVVRGKRFVQWVYPLLGVGKGTSSKPDPLDNSYLLKCECSHWSEHELKALCLLLSTTAILSDKLTENSDQSSDFNILPKSVCDNPSMRYGLCEGSWPISRCVNACMLVK